MTPSRPVGPLLSLAIKTFYANPDHTPVHTPSEPLAWPSDKKLLRQHQLPPSSHPQRTLCPSIYVPPFYLHHKNKNCLPPPELTPPPPTAPSQNRCMVMVKLLKQATSQHPPHTPRPPPPRPAAPPRTRTSARCYRVRCYSVRECLSTCVCASVCGYGSVCASV